MSESKRASSALIWAAAGLCIAAASWRYWASQGMRSYLPDEGIYTLVGWSWLQGDWPYRDAWDHKGPIVFVVPLLRTALLGTAPEMTAVQEIVLGALTALLLALAGARLRGAAAGAFAGTLSVLLWTQLGTTGGHMSTAGSIVGVLNALSVWLGILAVQKSGRARALACVALGSAAMLCFLAKPNAIGGPLAACLVIGWHLRKDGRALGRAVGLVALGLLPPLLLTIAVFAAAGALDDMIQAAYLYNLRVRGPSILAELGFIGLTKRVARGLLRLNVALITGLSAVACVAALLAARWPARGLRRFALTGAEVIAPLWLALEILIYVSNGVYGHHVYAVLPAAALSGALLVTQAQRVMPVVRPVPAALLALLFAAVPAAGTARLRRPVDQPKPMERIVAERIARETRPEDRGLVFARHWGPSVLIHAERKTAIRFFHSPGFYVKGFASNAHWEEVVAMLEREERRPGFILVTHFGMKDPPMPEGGPDEAWIVNAIDMENNRGPMMDPTPYPARERAKALIREHYRISFCEGVLCVLRPGAATAVADSVRAP